MKATRLFLVLWMLALTIVSAGCASKPPAAPKEAAPAASSSEEIKRHTIKGISYGLPESWKVKQDEYGGYMHYPEDGGVLYVLTSNWAPLRMWQEETAHEVLEDRVRSLMENSNLTNVYNTRQDDFKEYYSLHFQFSMLVQDKETTGEALIFVKDSDIYQFMFVYPPDSEDSVLALQCNTILDSIHG